MKQQSGELKNANLPKYQDKKRIRQEHMYNVL